MGMWEHYNIFLFIQKGYDSLSNILEKCLLFIFPWQPCRWGRCADDPCVTRDIVTCVV